MSSLAARTAVLDRLLRHCYLSEFGVVGVVTVGVLGWCTGKQYHCRLGEQSDRKVFVWYHTLRDFERVWVFRL